MNIPESITRCAVEGDLLKVVLDSRDSGSVPNARQLRDLKATVTATVPYLSPPEGMFVMPPFVFETNQVGQIINPESPDDAPLIPATNQTHTPEFRYLVEVTSPDLESPLRWRAAAPAGGVLNLSKVMNPPAPEDIPEWERVLAEVEAVRAAVQGLLTTTQGHASAAQVQAVAAQAARDQALIYRDQAGAIAAGDIIDDSSTSTQMTWSSEKIGTDLGAVATVAGSASSRVDDAHRRLDGTPLRNLVTNPSFEVNTAGWSPVRATLTRVTTYPLMWDGARSGAAIAEVRANVGSGNAYIWSGDYALDGLPWVGVAALAATEAGRDVRLQVIWLNSGGQISTTSSPRVPAEFYPGARLVHAFEAPAEATHFRVVVVVVANGVGDRLWVDSVISATGDSEAEALAAVETYFDGDSDGAHWEGAPHASVAALSPLPLASTTSKGIVELATTAETITGTDTARAVTPSGLAGAFKDRAMSVNPADYGVNVSGGDATTSMQALVTDLPAGSEIRMRPGQTVNLNGTVTLNRPVTIEGGTIIPAAGTGTLAIAADDVTLKNIKFAGTRTGTVAPGECFITTDATQPDTYKGTVIEDCHLEGMNHSGIWVTGLTDFDIRNNRIDRAEYAGIMGLSVRHGRISGNRIRDLRQGGSLVNSYGIAVSDSLNTRAGRSEHVLIDGNDVDGVPDWTAIDTHSGFDIKIVQNTMRNCRNAVAVTAGNDLRTTAPEDCYVAGNYMELGNANSQSAAIVFTGKTGGGLPDRITYGAIGTNIIRGWTTDLITNLYDPARMVIEPQSFDGALTGRRSTGHSPYRVWAGNITVPVTASSSGTAVLTFPEGYFIPGVNPTVLVAKSTASNAAFTPFESGATPTSVTVGVYNQTGASSTVNIVVRVIAIQVSPSGQGMTFP